jgi:hypothetical protein
MKHGSASAAISEARKQPKSGKIQQPMEVVGVVLVMAIDYWQLLTVEWFGAILKDGQAEDVKEKRLLHARMRRSPIFSTG